ncbi:MAG: hypothetical protein WBO29_16735 [Albidovulum sp.]
MPGYYKQLITELPDCGVNIDYVVHERILTKRRVLADDSFHIVDHGNYRHPRVLNTGVAYIFPFWNLDPWGIRAGSSIAAKRFDAQCVNSEKALAFVGNLHKRLVDRRMSRGTQPKEVQAFPKGCIAIFLQCEGDRQVGETCYLDRETMVATLMAREDPRPLVIKAHPFDQSAATRDWLAGLAARDARIIVTEANIHDILTAADVTVTINSAVGIESMLHRVPVVLCGHSDFHHCAVVVRSVDEMASGLHRAIQTDWPFVPFLFWYFGMNCISAGHPDLTAAVIARIAETGYDVSRFGWARGT